MTADDLEKKIEENVLVAYIFLKVYLSCSECLILLIFKHYLICLVTV